MERKKLSKRAMVKKRSSIFHQNEKAIDDILVEDVFNPYSNKTKNNKLSQKKEYVNYQIKKILEKNKKNAEDKKQVIKLKLIFYLFSNILNFSSITLYITQTLYENDSDIINTIILIDFVLAFYFIFEFLINLYQNSNRKIKFILSWSSVIDLISISNSLLIYVFNSTLIKLQFVRIFRILKIYKLLRIYESFEYFNNFSQNFKENIIRTNPVKLQFFTILIVLLCYFFIGTGIILAFDEIFNYYFGIVAFTVKNMNFFEAFYFMITTSTTIGYGDIHPTHIIGRILIISMLFGFLILVSNQLGKLVNLLIVWGNGLINYTKKGHIIIILESLECITIFLLRLRSHEPETDIVIISHLVTNLTSTEYPYNNCFLIHGEKIVFDVFMRANLLESKVIFIISPKYINEKTIMEQLTDLTLIKIRALNLKIPIIIQSLYDSSNFKSFFDKNLMEPIIDHNYISQTDFHIKRNIITLPIFKYKSMIHAKGSINPGFPVFIQNLLYNNNKYKSDDNSEIISLYKTGCNYKINIRDAPSCFIGKTFHELLFSIYIRSIGAYLKKLNYTRNEKYSIIVIGLYVLEDEEYNYLFYPINYIITENCKIVFLGYDDKLYINKFFDEIETETFDNLVSKKIYTFSKETYRKNKNEDLLILNDKKDINKEYFTNRSNKDLIVVTNEINFVPNNYEEFKQADIKNLELISDNYIESIINQEKKAKQTYLNFRKNFKLNDIIELKNVVEEEPCNINKNDDIRDIFFSNHKKELIRIIKQSFKLYGHYKPPIKTTSSELIEERILNIEYDYSYKFNDHIILIGYQKMIKYIISLLAYHHPTKSICIINDEPDDDKFIYKLIAEFHNLYYFKGDDLNPKHLINAGLKNAFKIFFLVEKIEDILNEDINKIITFRSIDYFFNNETIIEIWNEKNIYYLGYSSINNNDIFLQPLFMAGKIIYLSQLENIAANSFICDEKLQATLNMITCGYDIVDGYFPDKESYPVIITIPVSDYYIGLDYYLFVTDLLSLESPCLPLGLYVTNPNDYTIENVNQIRLTNSTRIMSGKKIGINNKYEDNYYKHIEMLKRNSYNNKAHMDFIDINKTHLPVFLTNPPPDFVLRENTYVMIIVNHKISHDSNNYKSKDIFKFNNMDLDKSYKKKTLIIEQMNKFYSIYNNLKIKLNKKYGDINEIDNKK